MILQKKNIHMVKIYDNIIPDDVCQKLIGIFETNVQHQHFINHNNCPCFTQLNLNQVSSDNVRLLIPFLADVYKRYSCLLYTSPSPRDRG